MDHLPVTIVSPLLFIVLFIISSANLIDTQDCTANAPDGGSYDLRLLREEGIIFQRDLETGIGWNFFISICQNLINNCSNCGNAGYCQNGTLLGRVHTYCVGTFVSIVGLSGGAGVNLTYFNPTEGRKGVVSIRCTPGAPLISNKRAITPSRIDGYQFFFDSSAACVSCAHSNCNSCTTSGCAWCIDTNSCISASTTCRNVIKNPASCPYACTSNTSCDTCTRNSCTWCIGTNSKCVRNDQQGVCTDGYIQDPNYCDVEIQTNDA